MKLQSLTVLRHLFFVLLVTGVLVLSSLLIALIKRIEHNVVYVLGFPQSGLIGVVEKDSRAALILLIVMIAMMVVFIFCYILVMLSDGRREMHLCATLIKQMEATQQAERKSMNKSLAFAGASHDVRAALAGITGLIEISYDQVAQGCGCQLDTNLRQMDACTKDLLGILNSILDTSKIEAGKMQLEEEEFDVAQLLEDVVDLYHPLGLKKGIDVVLDPYDGSIVKFSRVKGDRGRLKQILCNLISNAVKFTAEGHVTVRAWVEKPSFKNSITASDRNSVLRHLFCFFYKNNKAQDDMETMNVAQHDPNSLEFVIEVDDTGKGIPKEKQKSVFENYVQVKETALGEGGTGLGLGIVQSLVRLMHGEIGIVDKEIGEKGTCFRFNVLLTVCESVSKDITKEEDIESMGGDSTSYGRNQRLGIVAAIHTPSPGLSIHTPSPRLNICTPSPKAEGSYVVLLIKNEGRQRVAQKFMESLGIKVLAVEHWEQLSLTLKRITRHKRYHSHHSSSGISDLGLQDCLSKSTSCSSSTRVKEVPLMSAMDGAESNILSLFNKKTSNLRGGASGFILIVIDTTAGPLPELCKIVTEFKRGLQNAWCKVVWLDVLHSIYLNGLDPDDIIKHKPLHGTRLYEVVGLLPEFGGALPKRAGGTFQVGSKVVTAAPSSSRHYFHTDDESEIVQDHGGSGTVTPREKILSPTLNWSHVSSNSKSRKSPFHDHPVPHGETQQKHANNPNRSLSGKKFLVAEDSEINRRVAKAILSRQGATVEVCDNGREALDLVRKALIHQRQHEYDYILMDCEMPEMDGFEATRQIRKEEKSYNVRIPIIALTAHAPGEESKRMKEAGMDDHLSKPFNNLSIDKIINKFIDTKKFQI